MPLRGGGRGVSYPGPRGKRGAPRSLRKNLFDNFSILTANVNPFHVSMERPSRQNSRKYGMLEKKNFTEKSFFFKKKKKVSLFYGEKLLFYGRFE